MRFIMVKIIMGEKGTGKTKKLVDMVREAVKAEHGDVVVLEREKKLTYDIPYSARLIDAGAYPIAEYEFLKGLICGIHAGNYDITHFFIDNFRKLVKDRSKESFEAFIDILYVRIMAPSTILHSEYFAPNKYKTVLAGSFFNVLYSYSNSKLFHN